LQAVGLYTQFVCLLLNGIIMKTDLDSQKITVATVYRFITAFKIVPRVRSDKLAHKFVLSKKNILTHPEA
jgi:hypothetical protein